MVSIVVYKVSGQYSAIQGQWSVVVVNKVSGQRSGKQGQWYSGKQGQWSA